jgi:hypothetical protein
MNWRSIDFHGIVALDRRVVEQLDRYLQEKEGRLAQQILNIIQPLSTENLSPSLPNPATASPIKLAEAVEIFTKRIRLLNKKDFVKAHQDGAQLIKEINVALWEFNEVLEGCVVELFQQIKQVNLDRWRSSLWHVVQEIKDLLLHRIEDLIWTIRRIESPLKDFYRKFGTKKKDWKRFINFWHSQVDPAILTHLSQSEKLLKAQFEDFHRRYLEYGHLNVKIEKILDDMKTYPILALVEIIDQNLYIDVFRLLKLYELNPKRKGVLGKETIRSLKNLSSIDGVIQTFRIYYQGVKEAFFNSSLELKAMVKESNNLKASTKRLQDKVKNYEHELQHLILTMTRYREFMLNTNPNPYIHSRWGFSEWIVGPEPAKARELLYLIYAAEELKAWYDRFLISLNKDPHLQQRHENFAHHEIDKLLHEMGQPLASRSMMRNRAERLLGQMRECDEIGSCYPETIEYIQDVLSKAMREDWKYHVLHGFPLFHEIYNIHQGLYKQFEDPSHAFRMEKFDELFGQIEEWVRKEDIYSHVHEIELDINDMKIYLQDFLASIQRISKESRSNPFLDESIEKFQGELLEYRYAFGQFFYAIMVKDAEGQQLRNQFLFVDQYFEAIENLIHHLKMSWEGHPSR